MRVVRSAHWAASTNCMASWHLCTESSQAPAHSLSLSRSVRLEFRPVSDTVSHPQPTPRATRCFEWRGGNPRAGPGSPAAKGPKGLDRPRRQGKLLVHSLSNTKLKVGSTSLCITVHARQCCNLQPAGDGDGCCKDEAAVQGAGPGPVLWKVMRGKSLVGGSLTVALILILMHSRGGQHAVLGECRAREDGALHSHQPGWEESA